MVFVVGHHDGTVHLVVQDGETRRTLIRTNPREDLRYPVYAPSGYLVYQRSMIGGSNSNINSNVWALPFDRSNLHATGEPFIVAPDAGFPSVSDDGSLV
jgi:hypothetical protein